MKAKITEDLHVVTIEMIDNSFEAFVEAAKVLAKKYGTREILYTFTVDLHPITKIVIIFK